MKRLLVANRGEIAVRILRAARELELETVAVYSEADADLPHVRLADRAVCVGPANPLESYLNQERLLAAAATQGADALHPGYGFLSENPAFARRCEQAGLTFVGPTSGTIELMGNKIASRKTVTAHGVPVVPGYQGSCEDLDALTEAATAIGFPVILKAAAGGGGKGMQIVRKPSELQAALESARRIAFQAFGDSSVFLERYLVQPRHIEFQILGDHHGNLVHLFERECSIQRRHQKIVEETPSTALDPERRAAMGEIAVTAARSVGYRNAGTVEFIVARDGSYYFLEMNTRIQVEHPITELVTGLDLVQWQLRIAAGEPLGFTQEQLRQRGHAIECRIYAEDPGQGFLPSPGTLSLLVEPSGPGIRNDCGFVTGNHISPHYDSLLSKLITYGEDREQARRRMLRALQDYTILGVKTTLPFLRDVLDHPAFREGTTFTDFIPAHFGQWHDPTDETGRRIALLAAALETCLSSHGSNPSTATHQHDPWTSLGAWQP